MRFILLLTMTMIALSGTAAAESQKPLILFPAGAPGEKGDIGEEKDTTTEKDNLIAGRRLIRLGNVSSPAITVYKPAKNKDTGAAVIVMPGGGYHILALDLEGTEVCDWLNSIGVTGVLLKYRVPARKDRPRYAAPLEDAQRAMGIVRQHAKEWGIDPARIGVLGFSAGAHLAAALSNNFDKRGYETIDGADQLSCRPDFTVLIYPGYLADGKDGWRIPSEISPTAKTPPVFIAQTEDDSVPVEGSLYYYAALKAAKVPAEMHLYASGGHGYGLRPSKEPVTAWPKRAEEWMRALGMLSAVK